MFLNAAKDWVCNSYSIDMRYFAGKNGDNLQLWEALIMLTPLPSSQDTSFQFETNPFYAGQSQLSGIPKKTLLQILERAAEGQINVYGHSFNLSNEQPYNYYSEMANSGRWFSDLHLKVASNQPPFLTAIDISSIENALRRYKLPFDGLADISRWLGLNDPQRSFVPSINIRVGPPVDLIFPESNLADDRLSLTLHAHPNFNVDQAYLAVSAIPGKALESRKQIGTNINWKRVQNGRRVGIAQIHIEQADSVLTMLMIGNTTVRRHWFLDSAKARNSRLIAVQHFDKDIRMIKQAILENATDSGRFEKGIAALLFLLGFTPSLQMETDSPDLVVTTPAGKLVIVECTTRIADFSAKLGRLVDRRGSLSKALQASNHYSRVDAALVCALPKDQIATHTDELKNHQIILISKEDLVAAFDRLRFPNDPDEMLDQAVAQLNTVGTTFI